MTVAAFSVLCQRLDEEADKFARCMRLPPPAIGIHEGAPSLNDRLSVDIDAHMLMGVFGVRISCLQLRIL